MMLVILLLGGFIVWMGLFLLLDKPSVPVWKTCNMYRVVTFCLFILMMMMVYKGMQWRTELITLIPFCK